MRKILCCLSLAFSLASCSSWQEGWTEEYKQQFLQSCLSGDGRNRPDGLAFCQCRLEKTMATYPTISIMMESKDSTALKKALDSCK